ncbi:MAG: hypothetical protein KIT36_06515 [Alphaproteobacteria bacterium]|nr:hypothetical protein [Alphaproteobacteria bacterium]
MATRSAQSIADEERFVVRFRWTGLLNGDDGAPVKFGPFADRSVQVTGTFGAGGTLLMEGSNDGGTTWATLKDPLGANVSFTATGIKMVGDLPYQIRPRVSAGDGTTSLAVHLMMRAGGR